MATVHLSPVGNGFQFLSANVIPALALGKIYTYGAGTTTPQDTYTTLAGNVKNSNPITLNSDGRPPQEVWLVEGFAYRFDLKDAAGNLIQTLDNLYGINDLSVNAGPLPAASISFIQAGSGAVTRTGQSKMREWFSPEDFGAVGDGTTDDTTAISNMMTAAAGQEVRFAAKTYKITSPISIPANTVVTGEGPTSIIKTTTISMHMFQVVGVAGVQIRNLKFVGTNGTLPENNSGVVFSAGASNGAVEGCYFTGMAGWPIYVNSSDTITIRNNYITALGTALSDSAAIALYTSAERCIVDGNTCIDGGSNTWQGILIQVGARRNRIVNNLVTGYYAYGIIDYQPTPQQTDNIITGNTIRDINGGPAILGGNSGAGIYLNDCGGDIVANNNIYNTNFGTTTASLAPGAIGQAGGFSLNTIANNYIDTPVWYGICLATCTAPVNVIGNTIKESPVSAIYVNQSSNVTVANNQIKQTTTTPQTVSAIAVNPAGGTAVTNVNIIGNSIIGSGFISIYMRKVQKGVLANNSVVLANSIACKVQDSDNIAISGNYFEVTVATVFYALQVTDSTYARMSTNVLKSAYASGAYASGGTCTGSFFDKSNVIVGGDHANVDNAGTGARVEMISDNLTSMNAQAGDTLYYKAAASGTPPARQCTTGGSPGTWKAYGNLA